MPADLWSWFFRQEIYDSVDRLGNWGGNGWLQLIEFVSFQMEGTLTFVDNFLRARSDSINFHTHGLIAFFQQYSGRRRLLSYFTDEATEAYRSEARKAFAP